MLQFYKDKYTIKPRHNMKIEFTYQRHNEPLLTETFNFKDENNALFIARLCDELSAQDFVIRSIRCLEK